MAKDHGLCSGCCNLIEFSEQFTRHLLNKYHSQCFKCRSCQLPLRGSMIERGVDVEDFFCLSCASNGFQPKTKDGAATFAISSPPASQTTTTTSLTNPLSLSNNRIAGPFVASATTPGGPDGVSLLSTLAMEAKLKRTASPKPASPATPKASPPIATPPLASAVTPGGPGSPAPPSSPTPNTTIPPVGSPASSPFANAVPPVRSASFRLQLTSAANAAAKVAARSASPNQPNQQQGQQPPSPHGSSTSGTSSLNAPPSPTPAANVPPPFSSIHSASSPMLFGTSPSVTTANHRASNDRPQIGAGFLRSSHDVTVSPRPASAQSPIIGSAPTGMLGSSRAVPKRVPGSAVAALPPPPTLGTTPTSSPLSLQPSPRGAALAHPLPPTSNTPALQPTPPRPAATPPRNALEEEEERIKQEMEQLEMEERMFSAAAKKKTPPPSPRRAMAMPDVLTNAWPGLCGRKLEPDKPMKLQRHPNSKQAQSTRTLA